MCDLTNAWILESAQSVSVCTYHNMDLTTFYDSSGERRTTHSSELEGTQMLRREQYAHRWSSKVRGAMLTLPTRSSGERRTHSPEWEGTQTLRRERHAHRCPSKVREAMLALPAMLRWERHAHRWPSKVRGAMIALLTRSSGEQRTHSSEWEETQTHIREWHSHRWPFVVREQC